MNRRCAAVAVTLALALFASACSDDDNDEAVPPTTSSETMPSTPEATAAPTTGAPPAALSEVRTRLTKVASLQMPVATAVHPRTGEMYIAEQRGRVRILREGGTSDAVVDLSGEVTEGYEQGLLGLAFSRNGDFLYLDYTDREGDTHVAEIAMAQGRPDVTTRRDVLVVDQPFPNHNGGQLVTGPDGYLYIGLGDGGGGGDPSGMGQRLDTLLAKILRIDPRPENGRRYGVPDDNPFVGRAGARPEIWAYGVRNPWRFSFDRATGDLWIGDAGQSRVEEIDFEPAKSGGGRNYGWNRLEGSLPFRGQRPADAVGPIFELSDNEGNCAVIGGFVYRGTRIPALQGAYVFGDNCGGQVLALRQEGGRVIEHRALGLPVPQLTSFAEDAAGELYALSREGDVSRIDPG